MLYVKFTNCLKALFRFKPVIMLSQGVSFSLKWQQKALSYYYQTTKIKLIKSLPTHIAVHKKALIDIINLLMYSQVYTWHSLKPGECFWSDQKYCSYEMPKWLYELTNIYMCEPTYRFSTSVCMVCVFVIGCWCGSYRIASGNQRAHSLIEKQPFVSDSRGNTKTWRTTCHCLINLPAWCGHIRNRARAYHFLW